MTRTIETLLAVAALLTAACTVAAAPAVFVTLLALALYHRPGKVLAALETDANRLSRFVRG